MAEPRPIPSSTSSTARLRWLLGLLLTGQFMAILDVSIVNVATPTIRTDLHASGAALQLIVAGYTIAYAVLLITGARIGPLAGFGRAFAGGLAVFTLASLACGVAPTAELLIAFRVVQGAGAALMVPQVFSLIQRNFDGPARARALSLWAAVIALGALVGQVLGGLLVTADIAGTGWRPVFLVNVPIGALLLVASRAYLPADRRETGRRLDLAGLVTLAAAVLLLVVPLVLGHEEGWPAWTWASIVASAGALGLFAWIERGVERRGGAPLIAGRVLRAPGMPAALAAMLLGMAAYGGFLFSFAQHLQSGLGEPAVEAGLTFAPTALGFALTSLNWRRLPERWHQAAIPAGYVIAGVGYAATALAVGDGGTGGVVLPVALAVAGFGMGLAVSPILTVALSMVAPADAPDASGLMTTVLQLGQVVGVATLGSLFLSLATGAGPHPTAGALETTLAIGSAAVVAGAVAGVVLVAAHRRTSEATTRRGRPMGAVSPEA